MAGADELRSALDAIDPSGLSYDEWAQVGMALQREGLSCDEWDAWSARDPARYHDGECRRKWRSFGERDDEVTARTVFQMAYDRGWVAPRRDGAFGWDDSVRTADRPGDAPEVTPITVSKVDPRDVGEEEVPTDAPADPESEVVDYLTALFEPDERVGYVTTQAAKDADGKWKPCGSGDYSRTRDELVNSIRKNSGRLDYTFGTLHPEAGAWVRINPLDGQGASDNHVSDFRYALVESDTMPIGKQLAMIHEMRLPVAAIVTSGGKSVHAIVHVDASDRKEYRQRVQALYEFCRQSGFSCDEQNRNPSRLSRLPGFKRGDGWQRLVQAGPGDAPRTWDEWQDWVAEEASGLPDIVSLASVGRMPDLAPQLIHGVLRDGQKGMLVGPSKAGKSFALIELAIAVASGWEWMGHRCAQGRVLYVNMEIQQPSFYHRMADSYAAAKRLRGEDVPADRSALLRELSGVDVWCLRGHVAPMDRLAPMLVRRAQDRGYRLVIIDPIYKVLTGDENSASDMANFTNQFDVIAESLRCAVFYAHHHAKGDAGRRGAIDRASGSGVFARDPDAMLDMSPIAVPAEMRDRLVYHVTGSDGEDHERHASAYRISYTLREFETPPPRDVLFEWPLHVATDELSECRVVGEMPTQSELTAAANEARRSAADERWTAINNLCAEAIDALSSDCAAPTSSAVFSWLSAMRPDEVRDTKMTKKSLDRWASPANKRKESARFRYHKEERPDGIVVLAED